jgi:hypothetical protein
MTAPLEQQASKSTIPVDFILGHEDPRFIAIRPAPRGRRKVHFRQKPRQPTAARIKLGPPRRW